MTIIVGGYIVGYPLGGMTWHHLNYLLGLHELGHEVWFYEYGASPPFDPKRNVCDWDASYGTEYLDEQLLQYGLPSRWCYRTSSGTYNMSDGDLGELFARADLMICVSGITPLPDDLPRPRRTLVIDTDPVFTQLQMRDNTALLNYYKQFDAVATFGRLIGTPGCPLPTHGFDWIPTNQPIALRHWPVRPTTSRTFTTIGKWEHAAERHLDFDGRRYLSSKSVELERFVDLPSRTPWEMAMAMASMPPDVEARFASHGWRLLDPTDASVDARAFQSFVADSAGEFTVAKQIYSGIPSGWFSDRSACYLATGRPVVTQATGFDQWLPTGNGLFGFEMLDEADDALQQIHADHPRHARAARAIAEQYFDSRSVLQALLKRVL